MDEFVAYRILYHIFTGNARNEVVEMSTLEPAQAASPAVIHALAVVRAWYSGNYARLFRLYKV